MVTLPWHSGRPPECAGMVEAAAENGGVLFKRATGDRQEAAHRQFWIRLCGMKRGAADRSCPKNKNTYAQVQVATAESNSSNASTVYCSQISTCPRVPLQPSLSAASQPPPEDCVPMRGRTPASFPPTLFAVPAACYPSPRQPLHSITNALWDDNDGCVYTGRMQMLIVITSEKISGVQTASKTAKPIEPRK